MAFNPIRGTQAIIDDTDIIDGQLLFTTDTNRIYIDNGTSRILYQGSVVDSTLSTTSTNAIQNKAITNNTGLASNLTTEVKTNIVNSLNNVNSKMIGETVTLATTDWTSSTTDERYTYVCTKILLYDYGSAPIWGLTNSSEITTDAEDEAFALVQKMYFNQITKVATFYATDLPTTNITIKVGA
jgi:hypothetical protein